MRVDIKSFGQYQGENYDEIFITSQDGIQISFSNLGARINRWGIQVRQDVYEQIILGHENATEVFESGSYYGATVGRVAGRIARGEVTLSGKKIHLEKNKGMHHLHGGHAAMDLAKFDYEIEKNPEGIGIHFYLCEEDGKNGYPGRLNLKVSHFYTFDHTWMIRYEATSDQETLLNLTNHVYFNLNGNNQTSIENHYLQVLSDYYMPLDIENIPLGTLTSVEGTAFDLRRPRRLQEVLTMPEPDFIFTKGYDHPFLLDQGEGVKARLLLKENERLIEVETDQSAVVIYSHGYTPNIQTVWGNPIMPKSGLTFECQNLPDAIHHKLRGDTRLNPGEVYRQTTKYRLKKRN